MEKLSNWSLLVKPTTDCNIRCEYCFASEERKKNHGKVMEYEMVAHIAKLCDQHANQIQWIWHGGEPTLVGPDWYRNVQPAFYKHYSTKFDQSMQSNGTLINEDWFQLIDDYDIHIGISFDAFTQKTRDIQYNSVFDNIKLLEETGDGAGVIAVITNENYNRQIELYEYFKKNFDLSPSFNQIFNTEDAIANGLTISTDQYGEAFRNFYRYWLYDKSTNARSERTVMSVTRHVIGDRQVVCTHSDCRHSWLGISPTGEIKPCDRNFNENYVLGNIMDYNSIQEVYESENFRKYYVEVEERFKNHCEPCGYLAYCKGGCNANSVESSGSAAGIDETYCTMFRQKFNIVYDELRKVDLYKDQLNFNLYNLFATHPFFPIVEIKQFLTRLGYDTSWDYSTEEKLLLESTEFKVFRVFNIYKGTKLDGHTDHVNYPIDSCNCNDFNSLKLKRLEVLKEIYSCNIETIEELIGKQFRRVVG
ncbi:radical SAM/SPASM domain-containing protein [Alkaliphilus transvaalensis]|uniref:radical SAM/SPASM domain-containing protein n=1 Tax=Alkaliphilus transvaalensis TaxID=114628 RepID=UPI00047AA46A|nr:radical SAM protein [Alkaliphilus transvaalensis]